MPIRNRVLLFPLFLLLAGMVAAQQPQPQPQSISRVYFMTAKPGSEAQFEQGLKEHAKFHAQHKDPWRYDVRFTETGRRTGEYIVITSGHQWKDFDNPPIPNAQDDAHFGSTVAPHVASWSSIILRARPDLSRMQTLGTSAPVMMVTYFYLKYGKGDQFESTIKQFNAALDKADAPRLNSWSQVVGSSRNSAYVLTGPRENWAALEPTGPTMRQRLEQTVGAAKADELQQALADCVDYTEAKITSARADLSYGGAK